MVIIEQRSSRPDLCVCDRIRVNRDLDVDQKAVCGGQMEYTEFRSGERVKIGGKTLVLIKGISEEEMGWKLYWREERV